MDKRVGNNRYVIPFAPTQLGVADGLAVFGGCVQATQKRGETHCEVPVTAATWNKAEVVEKDHNEANSEE